MFSRHNRAIARLYLLADAFLALPSFWLAYWIRARLTFLRPLFPAYFYLWILALAIVIWVAVGLGTGIYREIREDEMRHAFLDPVKVSAISATLLFALIFVLKLVFVSRLLLAFFVVLETLAMILFRLVARRAAGPLRQTFAGFRQFLLVGETPEAIEIARTIEENEARGMRLFGFLRPGEEIPAGAEVRDGRLRRSYAAYPLGKLPELLCQHVIDEVIFAVPREQLDRLEETFLLCDEEGVKTRVLVSFFPHVISRVSLERLREMPLLTFSSTPENESLLLIKRLVDLLMALVLLLLLSPLFLILAALIKLTSRGPVFYRQTRCGLGARKFTLYKFRSMRRGADLERKELEERNEMDGPVFKIRNDPRCTAAGRFMRRFSLDELPQLFNILKGDMSFVGPRPPLPEEVAKYERWQRRRLRMQPGLTCLWALEGRSELNFKRWMELDLRYIDTWSPSLDWKILLKTIPVVLLGRGAS